MSFSLVIGIAGFYLLLLFSAAFYSEKSSWWKKNLADNSLVYSLSLAVYCTAWTFYGSIGSAATSGLGFLGVYLGPTLMAPLWIFVLKKMIRVSNHLRITSIADFVSARYGKSSLLGVMVSILCLLIVIPYISIQLKAVDFSFKLLLTPEDQTIINQLPFYLDPALLFVLIFGLFSLFFGTRKLDPSEKHPGLVSVVAIESIIKLLAFLVGAIAICFVIFDGIPDIFRKASIAIDVSDFAYLHEGQTDYQTWFWVMMLSGIAFLLLPRQFHMAVVENNSVRHLKKASWLTPLYLFLISIFVIPIAFAGKVMLAQGIEPDTYLLNVPLSEGMLLIAVIVFIGGLAAISGMIVISMISLSIMISNNIFLPILLKAEKQYKYFLRDLNFRVLQLRRLFVFLVIVVSYGFYRGFTINYSLVSVGLISFAGIAQLAPMVFLGLYWKFANKRGAIVGFIIGAGLWAYTLPIANLSELGLLPSSLVKQGPFGISWLRPTALFGLEGMQPIAHGAFWSLFFNVAFFCIISIRTERSAEEIAQSDIFINPEKYYKSSQPVVGLKRREANFDELQKVLISILGKRKSQRLLDGIIDGQPEIVSGEVVDQIETVLAGSIGSASASILLKYIVKEQPLDKSQLLDLLDQTYHTYEHSKALEAKKNELSTTAEKLKQANLQLQELDKLKNEFISNVTHELRTPITSIRSLADILSSYETTDEEKAKFLNIINEESERISNLVNQVLDLRKMEAQPTTTLTTFDIQELIQSVIESLSKVKDKQVITLTGDHINIHSDRSKLKQVLVNLIANAIKFTDPVKGRIHIITGQKNGEVLISIRDDGKGIAPKDQDLVFERFYQVNDGQENKTKGSGLGLAISKEMLENLGGSISLKSELSKGSNFKVILPIGSYNELPGQPSEQQ